MSTTRQRVLPQSRRHLIRAAGVIGAVLSAILVYAVAVTIGAQPEVPQTFGSRTLRPLEFGEVLGAATIASLAGWALLTILERFTAKAITIWTVVAAIVFLGTLPYMPGFSADSRVTLVLMHGALAAVLISVMRQTSAPAGRPGPTTDSAQRRAS
ncbi:DUF6069 family protein [Plantactinospora endophytica]|uniref:Uncharacterized protein n=1 Tax=Plantactinospora endophytica TaxID=673535 RepID=A0ABQ4E0E2_9ACTN|nr:DUF6069 family protein [Plantactinospora endophytica]GIG87766.1 hypothetical protein Pen02_27020 [Plantactinospora endophytica]